MWSNFTLPVGLVDVIRHTRVWDLQATPLLVESTVITMVDGVLIVVV